jgi:succinoglycan biosynthesis transport protein ExoP
MVFIASVQQLYTGTATVLIDPRRTSVVDTGGSHPVLPNFNTDDVSTESQVMLIQSVTVLQRVVDSLKLADDPEFQPAPGWFSSFRSLFSSGDAPTTGVSPEAAAKSRAIEILQKRLKVTRQKSTFLADINVNSQDPVKAAQIANAIAESYFIDQVRSKYEATRIATDWLTRQIEGLRSRVHSAEKAVADFRAANNLVAAQGVTVNDQQISDLNNKLVEARAKTAEARARFDQAQDIERRGLDAGSLSEALVSEIIGRLRGQYAELTKTTADLSSRYGPRHPLVAAIEAQVRDTQRLIDREVQRILQAREHDFEVALAREKSLQQSLGDLQGISTESSQAQVRLRELQRDADSNRTLYEAFLARHKETSAQESLEMPDSRIVTRAEAPLRPSFPRKTLILAFSIAAGVVLGALLAMLADFLDPRIKSLQQAETATGLPAIAAIPLVSLRELAHMAKRGRAELQYYDPAHPTGMLPPALQPPLMRYVVERPTAIFAEAVRAVRMAVQRASGGKRGQITMISSAIGGEGKSTLATNLAFSFATIGVRTILIDADLRHPELTHSLCPRVSGGLVEVATGYMPLQQAIVIDPETSLAVLPAPSPDNPALLAEFVFSDAMNAVLNDLRKHYDMIIVDAPPLLPLVDGRMLAEYADHIVVAACWDRTPQDLLTNAVEHLDYVRDRIIGTVLTQVDLQQAGLYDHYSNSIYFRPYDFEIKADRGHPA